MRALQLLLLLLLLLIVGVERRTTGVLGEVCERVAVADGRGGRYGRADDARAAARARARHGHGHLLLELALLLIAERRLVEQRVGVHVQIVGGLTRQPHQLVDALEPLVDKIAVRAERRHQLH